tara:strand:- start:246 stop:1208 length:963 start_codon:yes stop_codon:yes gene_type:complete
MWKERGYKITGKRGRKEGGFYHYILQKGNKKIHAVAKYTKQTGRQFLGLKKTNMEFLSQVKPKFRNVIIMSETEGNIAVLNDAVFAKAKMIGGTKGYWDSTGKKNKAFHIIWTRKRLEVETTKGRSDISWTINNCKVVLQEGKKKLLVDFLIGDEEFADNPILPRPANDYHGCYPMGFEKWLPKILEIQHPTKENLLHVFAGKSVSGLRVDQNPDVKPDLVADIQDLSALEDESFECAMADPPYSKEFAKELYSCELAKWETWTREVVKKVKVNGLIGVMHNWSMTPRLHNCEYAHVYVILTRMKQYVKTVSVFRKVKND